MFFINKITFHVYVWFQDDKILHDITITLCWIYAPTQDPELNLCDDCFLAGGVEPHYQPRYQ